MPYSRKSRLVSAPAAASIETAPTTLTSLWRLEDLRPTQMTVGFQEVARKRQRWRAEIAQHDPELWARPVPAVLGPEGLGFVLDRHHTLCALQAEGADQVAVSLVATLDHFNPTEFWEAMDSLGWCHPVDAAGVRKPCCAIPERFDDLADDPFRSLATALRRSGAYAKTAGPFSEFRWAAYLRQHLTAAQIQRDLPAALKVGQRLARTPAAQAQPGANYRRVAAAGMRPRQGKRKGPAPTASFPADLAWGGSQTTTGFEQTAALARVCSNAGEVSDDCYQI